MDMSTWKEIGEKWHRAQQMGFQAIQAAMDVGDELTEKKVETPKGEFVRRAEHCGLSRFRCSELMRLALHRELIEEKKPESMRQALSLLPKVPRKVSDKQIKKDKQEVDKYEEFAKETAKKQAPILAKKMVRVELDRLENQAHDALVKELKAVKNQLEEQRKRSFNLMQEAEDTKQHYKNLFNKQFNGFDVSGGFKILKQAVHPDRGQASQRMRTKAMTIIKKLEGILQL